MSKYFVYISKKRKRECPKYDSLDEAIAKYNSVKSKTLRDDVFLGIQSDEVTPTSGYCVDVIHKFFNENVLINDYLNHDDEEIKECVEQIKSKLQIRYQYTSTLPGFKHGVLINYGTPFLPYDTEVKKEWNEAYLSTVANNELEIVGWIKSTRGMCDYYDWNYPVTASYINTINVDIVDDNGNWHSIDMDPRAYLQMLGQKISVDKEVA